MQPLLRGIVPVPEEAFHAIEARLGITLSIDAKAAIRATNASHPEPRWIRTQTSLFDGSTKVPVYEFFDVTMIDEYCRICASHWNELSVPHQFLPFAAADADTFYLDTNSAQLRVMLWQYLEGDYLSHFQGEEMDCVADSISEFMQSFCEMDG
jgi:SMI1 / KNR4 family (SUKH-1)